MCPLLRLHGSRAVAKNRVVSNLAIRTCSPSMEYSQHQSRTQRPWDVLFSPEWGGHDMGPAACRKNTITLYTTFEFDCQRERDRSGSATILCYTAILLYNATYCDTTILLYYAMLYYAILTLLARIQTAVALRLDPWSMAINSNMFIVT